MLNWLFKKKTVTPAPAPAPVAAAPAKAPPAPPSADVVAARAAEARAWTERVAAALGDDAALLALAREAPSVEAKLAAVEGLVSEAALKEAEREFRTHDRRVHRIAKQRLAAAAARRTAREAADRLIHDAEALQGELVIAANRLVALDRGWSALDTDLLTPEQATRFATATETLTRIMRERADREAALALWSADARQATAHVHTVALAVAQGVERVEALVQAREVATAVQERLPLGVPDRALPEALDAALQLAAQVEARLALLASFEAAAAQVVPAPAMEEAGQPSVGTVAAEDAPAVDEVITPASGDAESVVEALNAGTGDATSPAPAATGADEGSSDPVSQNEPTAVATHAPDAPDAVHAVDPVDAVSASATAPEPVIPEPVIAGTAPAPAPAPRPADVWKAQPPLNEPLIARALEQRWDAWWRTQSRPLTPAKPVPEKRVPKPRPAPAPVDPAEAARLDGQLTAAETALAEGHLADAHQLLTALDDQVTPALRPRLQALWAEHGRLKGWQQWGGGRARDDLVAEAEALAVATEAPAARIAARQQADAIDALRKRWKELDRLGGASSQALWQRFDAALKVAHGPVAAHQARIDAERQANLEQRQALLDVLEATPPAEDGGWREQVRALDSFQTAWRKLGPLEHTVPHKSREALVARWKAAMARIEGPLEVARRDAERGREALVERARQLAAEAASGQGRDLIPRVRDLQQEWQEHAKAVPLSRAAENALWARFKAETDAVYAQREAAFNARDAEYKAHQQVREDLIARLAALDADTPAAELKRVLAEVDRQWFHAGDVPRSEVHRIEAAYREARETAQRHLAASAQRRWDATLAALAARVALCERREREGATDEVQAAWSAQSALPAAWDRALAQRFAGQVTPADAGTVDGWLLQLEMALDMPSPDDWQAARRELKLRAMKAALESRQAAPEAALGVDDGLARVLQQPALTPSQQARLDAVLDAVRRQPR